MITRKDDKLIVKEPYKDYPADKAGLKAGDEIIQINEIKIADYKDETQTLNLRVRSYFDANCAHCHVTGGEAGHMNLRFSFNETVNPTKMGVNRIAAHYLQGYNNLIIQPGNFSQSILHYRINTENDILYIMPPLGRTKKHVEGVNLVEEWINSL